MFRSQFRMLFTASMATAMMLVAPVANSQTNDVTTSTSTPSTSIPFTISGGVGVVTLSPAFVSALKALDVTVSPVSPTTLSSTNAATFPITGGSINLGNLSFEIMTNGGLAFSSGDVTVTLSNFIIDSTNLKAPVVTALVTENGALQGRYTLFDFKITTPTKTVTESNATVSMPVLTLTFDPNTASMLKSAFGPTVFVGGYTIGTVNLTLTFPTTASSTAAVTAVGIER